MRLHRVFEEAEVDPIAIAMDGKGYVARLTKGVKIVRDIETDVVAIYNTFSRGHFPREILQHQYNFFKDHGWLLGVRNVQIYNLNKRIVSLKSNIRRERDTNKNAKRIHSSFTNPSKQIREHNRGTERNGDGN